MITTSDLKKRYTRLFTILILLFSGAAALGSSYDIYPDFHSGSYSRGPFASLQNPVFSAVDGDARFAYRYMAWDSEAKGAHLLMLRLLGFSFTYGWYHSLYDSALGSVAKAESSYLNINRGFWFGNVFGFGVGYSMARGKNSSFDNYQGWSFGLLLRPVSYVSLGMAFNDVGARMGGASLPHREIYSISIRPYTRRVTLSIDGIREKGEGAKEMDLVLGAEVILPREISLWYRTDIDWNMRFGVTFPLHFMAPRSSTMTLDYYRTLSSREELNSLGFTIPLKEEPDALTFPLRGSYLVMNLNRQILEQESGSFFSRRKIAFTEIIAGLKKAREDRNLEGIVLIIDKPGLGIAQIQELREELKLFKLSGRPVYAIMKSAGNREYYLASAASRIYLAPNITFSITALSARVYFLKGLLDKVGVQLEEIRRGKYKSANEPLTRKGLSPEARENLVAILNSLNTQYLGDIKKSRKLSGDTMKAILSRGIMTPDEARRAGFIDRIAYPSDAMKDISESLTPVSFTDYYRAQNREHRWGIVPAIAVVNMSGTIVDSKSTKGPFSKVTDSDTYRKLLTSAFSNPAVRAVVIRIDSGGGSARASDYMLKHLKELKEKTRKPVIISFGNMAASGGYFIASSGDPILASRGSITGSIGVISGKLNLAELYKKMGINREVIKLSEFADIFDESRALTDREKEVLQKGTDFIYDRFTGVVMASRKLSKAEVEKRAGGRIFTGSQARKQKLVDRTGGISLAIELARQKSRIAGRHQLILYPSGDFSLMERMESEDIRQMKRYLRVLFRNIDTTALSQEAFVYKMPYRIEIR